MLPPEDREKKKALQKQIAAEGRRAYAYTVNIAPRALACLVATECGQALAIYFEPDERMKRILTEGKKED